MGRKPDFGTRMGAPLFVKVPEGVEERLREEAARQYRPLSTMIRVILIEWLDQHGMEWREGAKPKARRAVG